MACDLAGLATPDIGGRVLAHVGSVVAALAGGSGLRSARIRAASALGALLGPITLAEPDSDRALTRRFAVAAASAVLDSSTRRVS